MSIYLECFYYPSQEFVLLSLNDFLNSVESPHKRLFLRCCINRNLKDPKAGSDEQKLLFLNNMCLCMNYFSTNYSKIINIVVYNEATKETIIKSVLES